MQKHGMEFIFSALNMPLYGSLSYHLFLVESTRNHET